MLLYRKTVDKSVLWDGFSIPVQYHKIFHMLVPAISEHGDSVDVRTINEHIQKIFSDNELAEEATIRNFRIVPIRRATARLFYAKIRNFTLSSLKTCISHFFLVSLHVIFAYVKHMTD